MKKTLKKIFENSVKQQVNQMQSITDNNGEKNRWWKYAKKEVLFEPGWINDVFELREPEFYKLVTTVSHDDEIRKMYTVPVGIWNQLKAFEEAKCDNKILKVLPYVEETT